ncbi:hypothetical protein [Paraburkholderia gardini]|uniref:hypothetical protein n=1 Tax=Paraburkholderia gardini TaxID=2823469 RepID=UPI001DDECBA3|nr:hypothetical protein [Paraburkholderia gardini]CAG4923248.1 hypothetical protein R69919_05083 [Paraburkholderia gardini]
MTLIEVARRWREENGYVGRGGVIVLFDGEVQSWVNTLRNPNHWQPGCIAVDEDGRTWTTIAGNQDDGALMWMPNEPI